MQTEGKRQKNSVVGTKSMSYVHPVG